MTEADSELQLAREQGFFDQSRAIRSFLLGFLVLCVFAVLHFREVRVETLELGALAERYIVAQVDVEFRDHDATVWLKRQAERDIGAIYGVKEDEVRQASREFGVYLTRDEWRRKDKVSEVDELYMGAERVIDLLVAMRFTDPRTFNKVQRLKAPTDSYYVYIPDDPSLPVSFPDAVWREVWEQAFEGLEIRPETIDLVMDFFRQRDWTLNEDTATRRALQKRVRGKVMDQYTKISAGNRIIDQGEKVTQRHLDILQAMKHTIAEQRNLLHPITLLGSFLMAFLILGTGYVYFRVYHRKLLESNRKFFLVICVVLLSLLFAKVTENFLLRAPITLVDVVRFPLFVPVAAILLSSLLSSGVAIVVSVFLTIILTLSLAVEHSEFMLINLMASFVAILSMRSLRQRKEIFVICAKSWVASLGVVVATHLYTNTLPSVSALMDVISVSLFMLFTAILVLGLLPLFESAFRIITDVTLMEYMDPNQEILRRLSIEAPGTYQHSVVVGTLAEAAALAVGANGLFCRASTLYHDIGKLATPHYFTENQQGGMNMHQLLTPLESAQVIIAHVSEGVALARKIGLPEPFIDIIKEHHGTTLVQYFFHKQQKKMEEEGEETSEVNEKDFRYAGPRPRSKESAIIMIADSFEAASRSLDEISSETLTELINRLVAGKAKDGQFDQCLLTFEELGMVKRAMVNTLVAAGHSRVKYPEQVKAEEHHGLEPKEASESQAFDQSG